MALPITRGGPFGSAEVFASPNRVGAETAFFVSFAGLLLALAVTNLGRPVPLRSTIANIGFWMVGSFTAFFAMISQINNPGFCSTFLALGSALGLVGLGAVLICLNVEIQRTLPDSLDETLSAG